MTKLKALGYDFNKYVLRGDQEERLYFIKKYKEKLNKLKNRLSAKKVQEETKLVDDKIEGYSIEEYPYLAIIEMPEKVMQDKQTRDVFIARYEEVYCHKMFIVEGSASQSDTEVQEYLLRHNIANAHKIVWKGSATELVKKILEHKYQTEIKVEMQSSVKEYKIQAVTLINLEECTYAFYVINNNGKKLYTRGYNKEKFMEYTVDDTESITTGNYQIVYFVKTPYGKLCITKALDFTQCSNLDQYRKKELFIHGSCVSRDILNFGEPDTFKLAGYSARQSIFSVLTEPLSMPIGFELQLDSNFQKRMVEEDFSKNLFEKMQKSKDAYLVIDLIDSVRFNLYKYRNSVVTGSAELVESGLLGEYTFETISVFSIDSTWEKVITDYTHEIKKYFEEEKIIIHCAYFKSVYVNKNKEIMIFNKSHREWYKILNTTLSKLYDIFRDKLPNATYIDECYKDSVYADEQHHFGLSAVHYTEEYYLKVKEHIEGIK